MEKIWKIKPKVPEKFLKKFPEFPPLVLQLLYDRGLKDQKSIDEFFNPDYEEDLHDPFLMLNMKEVVGRIFKAVKKREKICIFGDYDADGVCGTLILEEILKKIGAIVICVYIPDRNKEGYGLNEKAINELYQKKIDLIISIDCGIRDISEVDLINKLGMKVIICDHHLPGNKVPKTKYIIDPFQKNDKYPFKPLAGASIAFKLTQALIKEAMKKRISIPGSFEKWFLDLVAIATVADCMPLLGENRTLVKYGLGVLAQTKRLGLRELMKAGNLCPTVTKHSINGEPPLCNLDTYDLGFILGPRLNSAGRMDHANMAYELLATKKIEIAQVLARDLEGKNNERQSGTEKIILEIEKRLEKYPKDFKFIFESDKNWPISLAGLVAGKLADKYHCPVFIINQEKDYSKGSARGGAVKFNVVGAFTKVKNLLIEFGGHSGAAGFHVKNENFEPFKKALSKIINKELKKEDILPIIDIDTEINFEDINWQNFNWINKFEPFGKNNPEPIFLTRKLKVLEKRIVGNNGKHLKLKLGLDVASFRKINAIGFNFGELNNKMQMGDKIDVVYEMIADEWNGNKELQLRLIDIKSSN